MKTRGKLRMRQENNSLEWGRCTKSALRELLSAATDTRAKKFGKHRVNGIQTQYCSPGAARHRRPRGTAEAQQRPDAANGGGGGAWAVGRGNGKERRR